MSIIERLEKAVEGSRELGRDVLRAAGWKQRTRGHFFGPLTSWTSPDGKHYFDDDHIDQHNPTTSIDAAMTLVPEGWLVELVTWHGKGAEACVCKYNVGDRDYYASAPTPALALCIAAMKARAALENSRG